MLMMTFHLSVTLLAWLAASGQARILHVGHRTLPVDAGYEYTYGDPAINYDGVESEREATTVIDLVRPQKALDNQYDYSYTYGDYNVDYEEVPEARETTTVIELVRPQKALDNPYDYSYTYGDYNVDYEEVPEARPTGSRGDDPLPDGVVPEVRDDPTDSTESPHDNHDPSPSPPEGVDDVGVDEDEQSEDEEDDKEEEKDEEEEEEEYMIFTLLQWMQDRLGNPGKTTTQMVENLRAVKETISNFLYQLKETVEMGTAYTVQRLRAASRDIYSRTKVPLAKLLQQLRQKNEKAVELFRLLGIKVQEWLGLRQQERQGAAGPTPQPRDDGNGDDNSPAGNAVEWNDITMMPNFFKDAAVTGQLQQLLQEGTLTKEELDALLEEV